MLIGVLSDTHDNLEFVERAVQVFRKKQIEAIVHCGDYVTTAAYDVLDTLHLPFYGVFGNNDYEETLADSSHGQIKKEPYCFELGQRHIFLCHHEALIQPQRLPPDTDIVCYGATHAPKVEKKGKLLIINPGETCGWVTGRATVACIDTKTLAAEIISLDDLQN